MDRRRFPAVDSGAMPRASEVAERVSWAAHHFWSDVRLMRTHAPRRMGEPHGERGGGVWPGVVVAYWVCPPSGCACSFTTSYNNGLRAGCAMSMRCCVGIRRSWSVSRMAGSPAAAVFRRLVLARPARAMALRWGDVILHARRCRCGASFVDRISITDRALEVEEHVWTNRSPDDRCWYCHRPRPLRRWTTHGRNCRCRPATWTSSWPTTQTATAAVL